jgi:hypothetical protein
MENIEVKINGKWIPLGELSAHTCWEVTGHSAGEDGYLTVYTAGHGEHRFRPAEWREYEIA